jgi:hypothetical protein
MNNTNTLAIVAVLMAATLVVGTFATVATTQSALAYAKKPLQDDNKKTNPKTTIYYENKDVEEFIQTSTYCC